MNSGISTIMILMQRWDIPGGELKEFFPGSPPDIRIWKGRGCGSHLRVMYVIGNLGK